jgi:CMP-N-acetylneuraminic acid synthetase
MQNTGAASGHGSTDSPSNTAQAHSPEPQEEELVSVTPADEKLWKSFSKIGNEMIVTKPGR